MKGNKSVKTLARKAIKLQGKIIKAIQGIESAEHFLDAFCESYKAFPSAIADTRAEVMEADEEVSKTLDSLSKPLDEYRYEARGHNRRYSSPVAQAAWGATIRANWAHEHLANLEVEAAKSLEEYTEDRRAELMSAWVNWQNQNTLFCATMARIRFILNRDIIDLAELAKMEPKAEEPEEYQIPARATAEGWLVMAENIAKITAKEVSFKGILFYANQIREWCKLEAGQLQVIYDEVTTCLTLKSDNSRATFKGQGDRPAPTLIFC